MDTPGYQVGLEKEEIHNAASPHVNAGIVWKQEVITAFWNVMWTILEPPEKEHKTG